MQRIPEHRILLAFLNPHSPNNTYSEYRVLRACVTSDPIGSLRRQTLTQPVPFLGSPTGRQKSSWRHPPYGVRSRYPISLSCCLVEIRVSPALHRCSEPWSRRQREGFSRLDMNDLPGAFLVPTENTKSVPWSIFCYHVTDSVLLWRLELKSWTPDSGSRPLIRSADVLRGIVGALVPLDRRRLTSTMPRLRQTSTANTL